MESTAQRSDIATPSSATGASAAPANVAGADDHYFMTSADNAPAIDSNVQLASAPPWLGALVVVFLISLVIGSALRRTLLRHGGPDFPHARDEDPMPPPRHALGGIRAHLRVAPVRVLRRGRH